MRVFPDAAHQDGGTWTSQTIQWHDSVTTDVIESKTDLFNLITSAMCKVRYSLHISKEKKTFKKYENPSSPRISQGRSHIITVFSWGHISTFETHSTERIWWGNSTSTFVVTSKVRKLCPVNCAASSWLPTRRYHQPGLVYVEGTLLFSLLDQGKNCREAVYKWNGCTCQYRLASLTSSLCCAWLLITVSPWRLIPSGPGWWSPCGCNCRSNNGHTLFVVRLNTESYWAGFFFILMPAGRWGSPVGKAFNPWTSGID